MTLHFNYHPSATVGHQEKCRADQNAYGQESKSAERYVRQGNVLPMATRIKISEIVFNERPVSIF